MSWKVLISLMTQTRNCSFGPHLFHYGAMNILELLYPKIKPLTPWAWSLVLIHHKSHACSSLISSWPSVVPSRYEPYDHLRVSHHRCPLGWLFRVSPQWHGFQHEIQLREIVVAWIKLTLKKTEGNKRPEWKENREKEGFDPWSLGYEAPTFPLRYTIFCCFSWY
jgi:hypothetical protein